MTNLEWLKKNLSEEEKSNVQMCVVFNEKIYKNTCNDKDCYDCPLNKVGDLIDFLLAEHKEPIKLKQWEYDLIEHYAVIKRFDGVDMLIVMRSKGHFKGVKDTSMSIQYILNNCEVIE
jgi:hypothetical protein